MVASWKKSKDLRHIWFEIQQDPINGGNWTKISPNFYEGRRRPVESIGLRLLGRKPATQFDTSECRSLGIVVDLWIGWPRVEWFERVRVTVGQP